MHAIILSLLLAGTAHTAKPLLEAHEGNSWTKLYTDGKGWRCETELTKHFYLENKPGALALLPLAKASETGCEHRITVRAGKQRWAGCTTDRAVKEFRRQLARDCGR
jgi:hypothetical protein